MKNKKVKQMMVDVLNYIDDYDSRVYKVESGEIVSYLICNGGAGDTYYDLEGLAWLGGVVSLTADQLRGK